VWINDFQEMQLGGMLTQYANQGSRGWSFWSPCSSFAATVWNSTTGEHLQDRHFFGLGYSDPNTLADSIDQANGNGRQ